MRVMFYLIDDITLKPILYNHCRDRPPVLKNHIFLANVPYFNATEPVMTQYFLSNGAVFQDRFHCTIYMEW